MAKLSQQQLDELALKNKKKQEEPIGANSKEVNHGSPDRGVKKQVSHAKIINDIMGAGTTQLYKYSLPEMVHSKGEEESMPFVNPDEYPNLNIKGKASRSRQGKPINFYPLEEVEHILNTVSTGNRTATINFLIWVGLHTLKGISQPVDIRVHDETYADGTLVTEYCEKKV